MSRILRVSCLATALLAPFFATAAGPSPAAGHPHIWIKDRATLDMENRRVVAITQEWTFDTFFSAALIKDFDANKDGKLDAAEIAATKKNAFDALKDFGYFTHVRVNGKKVPLADVRAFSARIEDGKVVYTFTLRLPEPIDPRHQKAAFLFYDHSYYVDVAVADAKSVSLKNGAGCTVALSDDKENPIYFGLVVPKKVVVTCADG